MINIDVDKAYDKFYTEKGRVIPEVPFDENLRINLEDTFIKYLQGVIEVNWKHGFLYALKLVNDQERNHER